MHHDHGHDFLENRLLFSVVLTALVFLVELGGGFWTWSLALLSDSGHVLTDAAARIWPSASRTCAPTSPSRLLISGMMAN